MTRRTKRWRIAPDRLRWAIHWTRIPVDPWLCDLTGWTVCIYPPACRSRRFHNSLMERIRRVRECGHAHTDLNTDPRLERRLVGKARVCRNCGVGIIQL